MFAFGFAEAEHDPPQLLDLRTVVGGGAGVHLHKTSSSQFNLFAGVSYARDTYDDVTTATTAPRSPRRRPARRYTSGTGGTPPGWRAAAARLPPSCALNCRVISASSRRRRLEPAAVGRCNRVPLVPVLPALGNAQDYRLSFDLSLSAQLNGWLQWNVSMSDRYLNIPPAGGAVQNDFFLSTGLGLTVAAAAVGTRRTAAQRR
jgi:hypothetical protein